MKKGPVHCLISIASQCPKIYLWILERAHNTTVNKNKCITIMLNITSTTFSSICVRVITFELQILPALKVEWEAMTIEHSLSFHAMSLFPLAIRLTSMINFLHSKEKLHKLLAMILSKTLHYTTRTISTRPIDSITDYSDFPYTYMILLNFLQFYFSTFPYLLGQVSVTQNVERAVLNEKDKKQICLEPQKIKSLI